MSGFDTSLLRMPKRIGLLLCEALGGTPQLLLNLSSLFTTSEERWRQLSCRRKWVQTSSNLNHRNLPVVTLSTSPERHTPGRDAPSMPHAGSSGSMSAV